MLLPKALVLSKTQTLSSTIWTQVTDSISYDDNHYAKRVSHKLWSNMTILWKDNGVFPVWIQSCNFRLVAQHHGLLIVLSPLLIKQFYNGISMYLPTHLHGQDMTQSQFSSGV